MQMKKKKHESGDLFITFYGFTYFWRLENHQNRFILGVGHYRWLCGLICRLPPNNKANYLVRTICHILDFLHL
jgi:hypothetical protein